MRKMICINIINSKYPCLPPGGGLAEEGEMIDVVEVSIDEVRAMVDGPDEVTSPAGLLYGLSWFLRHKAPPLQTS